MTLSVGKEGVTNMNDLTLVQKEMLKQMLDWDMEYRYPYCYFEGAIALMGKKILAKEMRGLISSGRVKMDRGGLNDDGEVSGGTGFSINYERRREIEQEII